MFEKHFKYIIQNMQYVLYYEVQNTFIKSGLQWFLHICYIFIYLLSISPIDFFEKQVSLSTMLEVFSGFSCVFNRFYLINLSNFFLGSVNVYEGLNFFVNYTFITIKYSSVFSLMFSC